MLETPHVALGTAIAVRVGNPLLAIPLSFISHFALEPLPHWNPHTYTEMRTQGRLSQKTVAIIWVDALTALSLGTYIAARQLPNLSKAAIVLLCSFASILPDLIEAPYYFLGVKSKYIDTLIKFQRRIQFDVPPLPGLIFQSIVTLILLNVASH